MTGNTTAQPVGMPEPGQDLSVDDRQHGPTKAKQDAARQREQKKAVQDLDQGKAKDLEQAVRDMANTQDLTGKKNGEKKIEVPPPETKKKLTAEQKVRVEAILMTELYAGMGGPGPGGFGKGPPGATVPVACVAEIAFNQVHDAVRPAAELRFILLGDFVRLLPFALLEITDRSIERHDLENSVST